MTRSKLYWAIAAALIVLTWLASALIYPKLPEQIPTHWNIRGEVDGYGAKTWAVFLMPAVMIFMLGFFRVLPALSPKNFEVDTFRDTYLYVMVTVIALFGYIHAVTLYAGWQKVSGSPTTLDVGRFLVGGIFLFLGLIGNVMGKIRRNFYMGIRVPWTLASDRVWNDTHRLAAWTLVAGSFVGFLLVVSGLSIILAFAVLMVSIIIPVVYSFVHYKQLEKRGRFETRTPRDLINPDGVPN